MSSGDGSSQSSLIKSKKPKYSRFTQQELPACKPILTPGLVISTFIIVGVAFIPIGLASLSASAKVVEIVDRYDKACIPIKTQNKAADEERISFIRNADTNKTCVRSLTVPKKMKKPIFIYYQLNDFYQNHRRYVKSRNDNQLRGKKYDDDLKSCAPEDLNNNMPIIPCGLVAWSLFNDTYGFSINNNALPVNKKDIAWGSDKYHKFSSNVYPKNFQAGSMIGGGKLNESIPLNEQEDLLVWMRTAALPTFRKLYGKLDVDLEANEIINVVINNNYNTYSFGGEKKLVISTSTWIGGKNSFIGTAYLAVGGLCLCIAVGFILMYAVKPRPFGDPNYLSWNRLPGDGLC
ncbi:hypothetical protein Leryth_010040 [Lithospermum erythrorhizon]|uniref:ALA-interacting subunit n=1 Tax=Lithospermum erythrorhizon TaxID=34254 RepID=A0AAV3QIP4_LITER|nr:hypothetical protein Leryth_010040 [Lithospermum erythrorhizon]